MDQIVIQAKIFYPKNRTQLHNGKIKFRHNITSTKAKPLRNLDYIENGQFFLDFLLHYQIIMDFFKLTCMVDRLEMGNEEPCCLIFELLL